MSASGQTNKEVDAGVYQLAALGDRVWVDTKANGIQDAGELGKSGVTVQLCSRAEYSTIATSVTDVHRIDLPTNLTPGSYFVKFVLPGGFSFSPKDVGSNEAVDSDADTTTGNTACVTLVSGQTNNDVDAGVYQLAALGDRVWVDTNANGIQDAGELGKSGVTVQLWACGGLIAMATTTTDANRFHRVAIPTSGSYFVKFVLPGGFSFSPKDVGSNEAVDSDADTTTGN